MERIFSSLISINAVVAFLFLVGYIFLFDKRSKTNRMLPVMLLGSGLWSLSNSVLIKNFSGFSSAKNCLLVEIVGIFLYVFAAQILFLKYSEVIGLKRVLCSVVAWAGLLVAATAINPAWLENAYINRFENLVSFLKSKDISEIFLLYMLVSCVSILIQILDMMKASKPKKVQIFGRKFLEILILNVVGIFFDQIFPKYSYLGFPGGVLTQFWGMLIMWQAVKSLEDVRINAKNLADKLSKLDGAPALVYGGGGGINPKDPEEERKKLQYANEAAAQYFNMDPQKPLESYSMNNLFEDVMNNYDRIAENVPDAYLAKCADKDEYCYLQVNDLKDKYGDSVASLVRINDIPNQEEARHIWENRQSVMNEAAAELGTARTLTNEAKQSKEAFDSMVGEAKQARDNFNSLANEARQAKDSFNSFANEARQAKDSFNSFANEARQAINHSELLADDARQSMKKAEQLSENARHTENYYRAKLNHEFTPYSDPLSAIWTSKKAADFSAPRILTETPGKEPVNRERISDTFVKETAKQGTHTEFVPKNNPAPAKFTEGVSNQNPAPAKFTEGVSNQNPAPAKFTEGVSNQNPAPPKFTEGVSNQNPAPAKFTEGVSNHNPAPAKFTEGVSNQNPAPAKFTERVSNQNPAPASSSEGFTRDRANLDGTFVRGTKALIASQNETERNALAQILQSYGIKVDMASNARDTMKMCKDKNYTLLFMDENLPAMNGAKTLGKIRGINDFYQDNCKILALSGATPVAHKEGAAVPHFDGYIEGPAKDVNVQMLLNYFLPKDKFSEGTSFSDFKDPEITVSKNIDDLRASFQASKAKKNPETPQPKEHFLDNEVSSINDIDEKVSDSIEINHSNNVDTPKVVEVDTHISEFFEPDLPETVSFDEDLKDDLTDAPGEPEDKPSKKNEKPSPAPVSSQKPKKPSSKFDELLNEERDEKVTKEHPSINDDYEDEEDEEYEEGEYIDEDVEIRRKEIPAKPKSKEMKSQKEKNEEPGKDGEKVDYDNLRDFKKVIPEVQREKASEEKNNPDLQPVKKHKK